MKTLLLACAILFQPAHAAAGTITDDCGRQINFDRPFEHIISLYAAHTENLFTLGLDREIIGVSKNEDYPPEALARPVFNARDGIERFLAAQPDLVLIRPMHMRAYPALWLALDKAGITVAALQPSSMDDLYAYWGKLGQLTARQSEARAMTSRFKKELADIRMQNRKASLPSPRVFFESIHRKMSTFSPNSTAMIVLDVAGGQNIAEDATPRHGTNIAAYGREHTLTHADEIDVYLAQKGLMNRVTKEEIVKEPGFSMIKAVKNGRVHLVDEALVSRPTPRLIQGIRRIHSLLYPDEQKASAQGNN